jgi:hypothetical protein
MLRENNTISHCTLFLNGFPNSSRQVVITYPMSKFTGRSGEAEDKSGFNGIFPINNIPYPIDL